MKTSLYFKWLPVAVTSCLAAGQLYAQDSKWFVTADAGPAFVQNITTTSTDLFGVSRTTKSSFKTGVRLDLDGGYQFNRCWALEAEMGYIYNPVDFSNSSATASPKLYQLPVMINTIYTLPFDWRIKPYFGLGAGIVFTGLDDLEDVNAAGQVIVGAKYEINRRIDAGLAYRLLVTTEHDWNDLLGSTHGDSTITHSIVATVGFKF